LPEPEYILHWQRYLFIVTIVRILQSDDDNMMGILSTHHLSLTTF